MFQILYIDNIKMTSSGWRIPYYSNIREFVYPLSL